MADGIFTVRAPDLSRARIPPAVPDHPWLLAGAPRARFALRGGPDARAAAGLALGFALPESACRATMLGRRAALWLGPDEQLLTAPEAETDSLAEALGAALNGVPHSLVDISHRQTTLEVRGPYAETILNGASPLDLSLEAFPVGMCTRTVFDKADIVLSRTRTDAFEIEVWRSFADYVTALLVEIARDYAA